MISDFEQELTAYLNLHLPAPFAGRVVTSDGTADAGGLSPAIHVGVTRTAPQPADMGPRHGEIVPGSSQLRRVLQLVCTVGIAVYPSLGGKRAQELSGVEAIQYLLDTPEVRNGRAFVKSGDDQGFLIHSLQVTEGTVPLVSGGAEVGAAGLTLEAKGWFWPKGVTGETGIAIATVRVRGIGRTLRISPSPAVLRVGGPPMEFTLSVSATGPMALTGSGVESSGAFGLLYCDIRTLDGSPPSGSLSGGSSAASEGGRLVALADGEAVVTYTPGNKATVEELFIALDNGEQGEGVELGRMRIETVEGP